MPTTITVAATALEFRGFGEAWLRLQGLQRGFGSVWAPKRPKQLQFLFPASGRGCGNTSIRGVSVFLYLHPRPIRRTLMFVRSFTPRTWLGSVRNFAKTRFRRFPMFHFSMLILFLISFSKDLGLKNQFFANLTGFWRSYGKQIAPQHQLQLHILL